MQVIPTVGASDENSVRKQLKYFANIIDCTASKAGFIANIGKGTKGYQIDNCQNDALNGGNGAPTKEGQIILNQSEMRDKIVSDHDTVKLVEPESSEKGQIAERVSVLLSICGSSLTEKEAISLLRETNENVDQAVGLYFDRKMAEKHQCGKRKREGSNSSLSQQSITSFFSSPGRMPGHRKPEAPKTGSSDRQIAGAKPIDLSKSEPRMTKEHPKVAIETAVDSTVPPDAVSIAVDKYDPIQHAPWKSPSKAPYLHVARTFQCMESTKKRLKISDMLMNAFRSTLKLSPEDLIPTAYLFLGRLAPDYEGLELNIGGSSVASAMTEALGISRNKIRELHKSLGDLGDVAASCKRNQATLVPPAPLSVLGVYNNLKLIARESGQGSGSRKKQIIVSMLRMCREAETRYLVRTMVQALRVGASWRSVLPSLAKAIAVHKFSDEGTIMPTKEVLDLAAESAITMYHVCPNLETVSKTMLKYNVQEWRDKCHLTPGIPIKPMLAKISEGVTDALEQILSNKNSNDELLAVEWKYDGMRAQIHINKDGLSSNESHPSHGSNVKIFSRNGEDRTHSFPDVANQILESTNDIDSCILDAEIVAIKWKGSSNEYEIRAFQDLSSRPRETADLSKIDVDVCIFVFDILERDGLSCLQLPLCERRKVLNNVVQTRTGKVELAHGGIYKIQMENGSSPDSSCDIELLNPDRLQKELLFSLEHGAEGLMLKSGHASYEPNKRSNHWIKLKRYVLCI